MKNEFEAYRRRLEKFNHWELEERKTKSEEALLEEFRILFNLTEQIPGAVVLKSRQAHLDNLVAMRKRLKKAGNRHVM